MEHSASILAEAVMRRIFLPLEASGRHVHLTGQQAQALFGHDLTPARPLSQPGQFLAQERLCLEGPAGKFENVAVLGPVRSHAQVEISLTDGRTLGIVPPVRLSGDTDGSPGITLIGTRGSIHLENGVIAAQRHLHLTPESAQQFGVTNGQSVRLQVFTDRPLIFDEVIVRISRDFFSCAHLDYDEANACGLHSGDLGRILP